MQTGDGGIGWLQVVGAVIGAALVAGVLLGLFWFKKRRREQRRERPPQREKLLRPAGYWAMKQVDERWENLTWAVAQTIGAGVFFGLVAGSLFPLVAGLALGRFTLAQVWGARGSDVFLVGMLMGVIALLWAVRALQRIWRLEDEIRNWRFGLRGEQAVAEKLASRELAAAGYVAFHDVPGDGKWNIDHVVVGPGGVFVLETKARARRKATRDQEESLVLFDGRNLQFPWCDDRKAAGQAERNADWVRQFIADFAPKDILVQPVVVVPGWYVKALGNFPVKVMNATYLVGYVAEAKAQCTAEQLRPIIRRLDERCRDLEF